MVHALKRAYRLLNILSIDVAVGSVCCALFFAKLLNVSVLPYGLISLALTVWIIYTADHLLDAARMKAKASTARHQFHQQHFQQLLIAVAVMCAINLMLIFFIRRPVFWGGVVLAVFVGFYLLVHRFVRFPKEFFIAILYTLGVLLPSASVTTLPTQQWPWVLIMQFTFIALMNLLIFSWFDADHDVRDGSRSFVTLIGRPKATVIILSLVVINILLSAVFFAGPATVVLLSMTVILACIFTAKKMSSKNERFRIIGDAIFFLPLIYWWWL